MTEENATTNQTTETEPQPEAKEPAGSTFAAGQRAEIDLRDSSGAIALRDGEPEVIRVVAGGTAPPFVLKEGDHLRVRMTGGHVAVPRGLPVHATVPPAVQLKVERTDPGETVVRPVAPPEAATTRAAGAERPAETVDLDEFAREMSETAQRIFQRMTQAVRAVNSELGDQVAPKLDEAAARIDEQARRIAERVQREVERANASVVRAQEQARRAAHRAEEHAARAAEKIERRAAHHGEPRADRQAMHHDERMRRHDERMRRHEERVSRVGRGRGWFADRLEEWASANAGTGASRHGGGTRGSPGAAEERRAILAMLAEGKITSEQASRLLDALGA